MRKLNILSALRALLKFYEKKVSRTREQYGLTQFEVDVLAFLHNNPGKDTAKEVSEYRMLAKANVSQAVDSLVKRGYLETKRDENDRRLVHLKLTNESEAAVRSIMMDQEAFEDRLLANFTAEEIAMFTDMEARIAENVFQALKED